MNDDYAVTEVVSLKASFCFIEKEIGRINNILDALVEEHRKYDEYFWELKSATNSNLIKLQLLEDRITKSTVAHFIKNNWWKVGGTLISIATILGAIGEYLYRLPPPK